MSFSLIISTIIDGGIYLFLLYRILIIVPVALLLGVIFNYNIYLLTAIIILSIASVYNQVLRAKMESLMVQQKMIFPELFSNLIFSIALACVYSSTSSYIWLIYSLLIRELSFFIFSARFLKIKSDSIVEEKIQQSRRKKLFHPSLVNSILVSGDLYLLNIVVSSNILGQYSLVRNLGQTGSNILTQLITKTLVPDRIRQVRPNLLLLIVFLFLGSTIILLGTDYLVFFLWDNTDESFVKMSCLVFVIYLFKLVINYLNILLLKADNYRAYRVSQIVLPLIILTSILIGAHYREITIVFRVAILLNLVHFSVLLVANRKLYR